MRGCIKTLAIISTTYLTHTPTHFIFRQLFINLYRQIHFHQFNLALRPTHTRRAFITMKNIKLFLALLVVSMSSICLTSCGDDEDINNAPTEPNDTSIIGTWRNTSPTNGNLYELYLFSENGEYTYVIIENSTTFIIEAGTYQLESGVLEINSIRSENPGLTEYNCQINGNEMEITGQNGHTSYSRVENNAGNIAGT